MCWCLRQRVKKSVSESLLASVSTELNAFFLFTAHNFAPLSLSFPPFHLCLFRLFSSSSISHSLPCFLSLTLSFLRSSSQLRLRLNLVLQKSAAESVDVVTSLRLRHDVTNVVFIVVANHAVVDVCVDVLTLSWSTPWP